MVGYFESFVLGALARAGLLVILILWFLSAVSKDESETDRRISKLL